MADLKPFATQTDYTVPLLRLLAELPGGQGKAGEVTDLFEEKYRHLIPDEHRGFRDSGEPIWGNNVAWSRNHLKDYGLLDAPAYGVWRITDAGRQWLQQNPNATRIKGRARGSSPRSRTRASKTSMTPGITLEMLEQTRKVMLADQFRQVWGALYDQLLSEERTRAVTQITQAELGRRTRRWLDDVHAILDRQLAQIRAFLQGRSSRPSDEVLCDWVQFCYTFELFAEGYELFKLITPSVVNDWLYGRTKRLAQVCHMRAGN